MTNGGRKQTIAFGDDGLGFQVLCAFKRACSQRRFDIAEHLLRALEVLEGADEAKGDARIGMSTVAAYRYLARLPDG